MGLKEGYAILSHTNGDHEEKNGFAPNKGHQFTSWQILKNKYIWHTNKRNIEHGVGVDIDKNPLNIKNNFVPRRKESVRKLQRWSQGDRSFQEAHRKLEQKMDLSAIVDLDNNGKINCGCMHMGNIDLKTIGLNNACRRRVRLG